MWSQPSAQKAIIVAGCFGMAYTQLTMSPATIEYARSLGADGLHFGILGALPAAMLVAQFLAAVVANHLRFRRRVWIAVSCFQRLALVPVVCGPLLIPSVPESIWIWAFILATAANHAMLHFCTPLWLSWMGDYLPRQGLSRFWGRRHLWMQWAAAAAMLGGALFVYQSGWPVQTAFAAMVIAGAVFGLVDVLLFTKIDEPPVRPAAELRLRSVLTGPFRRKSFRTFITYTCFWNFAAMVGAPFISLFLLSQVGLNLFYLLLLWTCSWVGGAVASRRLGCLAELFGNRPLLILCTAFKPVNMIGLLLIPADPFMAFWLLVPIFMLDALLNAGIAIATNGFLLKNSPAENRTMFLAAGTALAGMIGGLTSVVAGGFLSVMQSWHLPSAFHVLFAASLALRLISLYFAWRIEEPESDSTMDVVCELIGVTPLRILRFPLVLYEAARSYDLREVRASKLVEQDTPQREAA